MKIDRNNWQIESVTGHDLVMIIQKEHGDERIVSGRQLPSIDALQAMSDLEFERAARGAFLGWDMAEEKPATSFPLSRVAAGLVLFVAAVAVWAGLLLWD